MTPKIIQTPANELAVARSRMEKLEAENRELRLTVRRLTLQTENTLPGPELALRLRNGVNEHSSSSNSSREEVPSFARPTRASRFRQSPTTTTETKFLPKSHNVQSLASSDITTTGIKPVVVYGKTYTYDNGKLAVRTSGYLVSTTSAINKFGHNERQREEDCGVFRPSFASSEPLVVHGNSRVNGVGEEHSQPDNPLQIISQTELEDMIEQKGISLRTRLQDDGWVWQPATNICLDHDELFDILSRGEKLAKLCLWRWLQVNRPRAYACQWLHYLSDMDLGRDTLSLLTYGVTNFYEYRHTKSDIVEKVIEELITLRNRVHHFKAFRFNMRDIDEHLYYVQKLAVLLYDEEAATSARGLRDRLRHEVEGVAREIEALGLLIALPFAGDYPWKYHHIELFNRVLSERKDRGEDYIHYLFSPSVIALALEFEKRSGSTSWDCAPIIEESVVNVERLGNGVCGSIGTSVAGDQRDRVIQQSFTKRLRSASTNGSRRLSFRGEQAHMSVPTRRASL